MTPGVQCGRAFMGATIGIDGGTILKVEGLDFRRSKTGAIDSACRLGTTQGVTEGDVPPQKLELF